MSKHSTHKFYQEDCYKCNYDRGLQLKKYEDRIKYLTLALKQLESKREYTYEKFKNI